MEKQHDRVYFTREMKFTHTILIPNMLPYHFKMLSKILNKYGYNVVLLETSGRDIIEHGLKYVHNDACYPAQLVIGQFLTALESGKYDPHKTALMFTQTGGGCRASNYISMLRKALERAGFGYVPVISLSMQGIEENPGFKLTLPMLMRMMYAILYGDILALLVNQVKPYEVNSGESEMLAEKYTELLTDTLIKERVSYKNIKRKWIKIVKDFDEIQRVDEHRIKVGIVGEIFVKYSPLGNNELENYLISEKAEPCLSGFLDFAIAWVYNYLEDKRLYNRGGMVYPVLRKAYKILLSKQDDIINIIKENSSFRPPVSFEHKVSLINGYIGTGMKMGEGWLLTAEILEFIDEGINNVICVQPFGCLPNHIAGRGIMQIIKKKNPSANIAAIDYDSGSSGVNQRNRIKLMLQNAEG